MLLESIAGFLESHGIAKKQVDLFIGSLPESPDNCVALFEYPGEPRPLHWDGDYPRVQVLVRHKSYPNGRQLIERISQVLHGDGVPGVMLMQALQNPYFLQRDENNRAFFVVNFRVIKHREAS